MHINKKEIEQLDPCFRTTFINSLAGFRQAVLVGTKSVDNNINLAIFNSLIHLGANPALFGLISRPEGAQRDTLKNILDTKEYTLNFVKAKYYKEAHQTSARYDKDVSEFEKTGFIPFYKSEFHAPFVHDAVVNIAMKLEDSFTIPINGTILIVGSIMQVELNDSMVGVDGFVNLTASESLISQGLDAYFVSNAIGRLPYAKP